MRFADPGPPLDTESERYRAALRRLPSGHALALRLRAAGVDDGLLADCLAIEPEAVDLLITVAEEKLAALLRTEHDPAGRPRAEEEP